jgi:hypothetical protein
MVCLWYTIRTSGTSFYEIDGGFSFSRLPRPSFPFNRLVQPFFAMSLAERSEIAAMVMDGLRPTGNGSTEPSATNRFG